MRCIGVGDSTEKMKISGFLAEILLEYPCIYELNVYISYNDIHYTFEFSCEPPTQSNFSNQNILRQRLVTSSLRHRISISLSNNDVVAVHVAGRPQAL